MKNIFLFILLLLTAITTQATSITVVDLELSSSTTNQTPLIYSEVSANFIINNTSNEIANNIIISIPVPDGFVLTGSNQYTATRGTYSDYFGTWKIDNLEPGASETLTLNIFTLTDEPVNLYGQVSSHDEVDMDSTPGNGVYAMPEEDDETNISFNQLIPECAVLLGEGSLNCIMNSLDGGKTIYQTLAGEENQPSQVFINQLNNNGELVSREEMDLEINNTFFIVRDNEIRTVIDGVVTEVRPLSDALINDYPLVITGVPFNDGFIFFAYAESVPAQYPTYRFLMAIRTDEDLNPIAENIISSGAEAVTPQSYGVIQISPNQVALTLKTYGFNLSYQSVSLVVVNSDLELLSRSSIAGGRSASGILKRNLCGDFRIEGSEADVFGDAVDVTSSVQFGSFVDGSFVATRKKEVLEQRDGFGRTRTFLEWDLMMEDGSKIIATSSNYSSTPSPTDDDILIEKIVDEVVVSSRTIELPGSPEQLMNISGDLYFLTAEDGVLSSYKIDCLEDVTLTTDGVDLELTSALSVDAPDIYSNYSVVYTLVNNGTEDATGIEVSFLPPAGTVIRGSNPFSISRGDMSTYNNLYTLDELPAGETTVIELNYFSLTDSPINHYAEVSAMNEDDLDSTPNNGTPPTVNEDDETSISTEETASTNSVENSTIVTNVDRLEILKLFPNPSMEKDIRMTLTVPESKEQTLLIYNELGVEVLRTNFDLSSGFNELILPTKNLNAGMYRVVLPGHPMRFGSASFMVIR